MAMMASMSMTTTAPSSASTSSMSMSGMDMGGSSSNACKISMLWNWYTVDACFISSTWQVTSRGMFAGSCIGVIFLVQSLEFLRRLGREYDQYILRQLQSSQTQRRENNDQTHSTSDSDLGESSNGENNAIYASILEHGSLLRTSTRKGKTRPRIQQQLVRALIHMLQFAVAYFVMLLAMYYNGYIIICILIGAFLGFAIFSGEGLGSSGQAEVTGCCG